MALRTPAPDFGNIVRDPVRHAEHLRATEQRFLKLEKITNSLSINTSTQKPAASRPPRTLATIVGAVGKGRWRLGIRNPEFGNRNGSGKHPVRPIYHEVHYSTDPTFASNVVKLDLSHQTNFPITEDPGATLHIRWRSSYDGENFNDWQHSGPVQG